MTITDTGTHDREEEHRLIRQAQNDPEAFGELYRCYVHRIYNYHYRHVGSQNDAEDLTSRTFYRALRNLHRYRDTGASFQAWLFRIAHNLMANWHRDQQRHPTLSIDAEQAPILYSHSDSPEDSAAAAEAQEHLLEVIDHLPEDRKTLLILKFVEQLTNKEIGVVLGKSEGAVKALYHRTLLNLRRIMRHRIWK